MKFEHTTQQEIELLEHIFKVDKIISLVPQSTGVSFTYYASFCSNKVIAKGDR